MKPTSCLLSLCGLFTLTLNLTLTMTSADELPFYIGTYTGGESKGIYRSVLDLETGACTPAELVAETPNPSFVAVHPSRRHLYAVNEIGEYDGQPTGSLTAFAIEDDGTLKALNSQPSQGTAPCHLSIDATGRYVLVANYGSGTVASLPIHEDGTLGAAVSTVQHQGASIDPNRQRAPHAHSINLHHDNRHAFAADLGLDKVLVYAFNPADGSLGEEPLTAGLVKPGAGPRHAALQGNRLYAINELDSTITLFHFDSDTLVARQSISTLPPGFEGRSHTAEVRLSPDGRFVYGSNRGHDSIAVFQVTGAEGELTLVEIEPTQGRTPRNFALTPDGSYLLAENQGSDTITVFRRDPETGELHPSGHQLEVPSPVCVRFLP